MRPHHPIHRRVDAGAVSLAYLDYRPARPTAPAVVLLHGAMGRGAAWDRLARELCHAGHRVLAPDQRGHGRSDKPAAGAAHYGRDAYVGDLARFLDALEIDRCVLVGHSTGALNALVYAARHPGRVLGLVLEEHGVEPRGPGYLDGWRDWLGAWPARFSSLAMIREHFGAMRAGYADHFAELFEEVQDGWRPLCDPAVVLETIAGNQARAWWDELAAVECPTLVVKGEDSDLPAGEVERMARVLPRGRALIVPGAGHAVHDECPATFLDACLGWLREHGLTGDGTFDLARSIERQYETGEAAAALEARRAALVVIDMQHQFTSPDGGPFHVPGAAACLPAVIRLLAGCRERGVPVIHTAFADTNGHLDRPRLGPRMPNRFPELAPPPFGAPRFAPGVEPRAGEPVILKPSYGAFVDTPLETILKNLGRDTVVLAGTLTNFCVGATARQAYERSLLAVVAADACASDSTRAHLEELRVLRRGFARVATVSRVLDEMDASDSLSPRPPTRLCASPTFPQATHHSLTAKTADHALPEQSSSP